jgi:cardiolipin synthase
MKGRSPQGTIAWAISLITFPTLALPLYLIFGSRKFHGYVKARKTQQEQIDKLSNDLFDKLPDECAIIKSDVSNFHITEKLARMPFTKANSIKLLINGENTFNEIFKEIDKARDYIIVQFFIVRNDDLGNKLKNKLIYKATQNIKIYFLYDEIGSHKLPKSYIHDLKKHNIQVSGFKTTKGPKNKFQLNFRNHRKIVVVDGDVAFVGGHNVGDEYLGKSKKFKGWRDTHVMLKGPSVQAIQLSFIEDWYWATNTVPDFKWIPNIQPHDKHILVLPSGPADVYDTCELFFLYAINHAQKRIWITSPYFVPDDTIISALHLAALKGIDVRIMLPEKPDHILVYLSSFAFLDELSKSGIKFYRYNAGFLHQKVMLIDDDIATVGTANFDNRSFKINFEITILSVDKKFAEEVEQMLIEDFKQSREITVEDYLKKPLYFKLAVSIARLMAPIQ